MLLFGLLGLWAGGMLDNTPGELPPDNGAPKLQFNDELNSQLLALLEDF